MTILSLEGQPQFPFNCVDFVFVLLLKAFLRMCKVKCFFNLQLAVLLTLHETLI